jgi:hypothetical protein
VVAIPTANNMNPDALQSAANNAAAASSSQGATSGN